MRQSDKSLALLPEETDQVIGEHNRDWDKLVEVGVLTKEEAEAKKAEQIENKAKAKEEEEKKQEEEEAALQADKDELWKANRPIHKFNEAKR